MTRQQQQQGLERAREREQAIERKGGREQWRRAGGFLFPFEPVSLSLSLSIYIHTHTHTYSRVKGASS